MLTCRLDTSRLDAALRSYLPTTQKSLAEVTNQRAYNIIMRALAATPRADRAKIEAELGVIARQVIRSRKTGKTRAGKAILADGQSLALILAAVSLAKQGVKITSRAQLDAAAQKLLGVRLKSIGFVASGWIPGLRRLAEAFAGPKGSVPTAVRQFGKPQGYAQAAQSNWTPSVLVVNDIPAADKIGAAALQSAVDAEAAEITRHVEEKLAKATEEFNRR